MQIRLFDIPTADNGELLAEMNRFLANSKVLEIEQKFYQNENGSYWSFCVRYISVVFNQANYSGGKIKTDYKQTLSEKEFSLFSKLRVCRKIIAENDAVPAYAVFTDEELAGIAKLPIVDVSKLILIKGIGDKKVEKYGQQLIELFNAKLKEDEKGE